MTCKCALSEDYGGMFTGGGYTAATEYELGAQRIAEATHCILGSLHKMHQSFGAGWKDIESISVSIERGHIREEMGIINKCMTEYSRDYVLEHLDEYYNCPRPWRKEWQTKKEYNDRIIRLRNYAIQTINGVPIISKVLIEMATDYKAKLGCKYTTPEMNAISAACYDVLISLGKSMRFCISSYPKYKINPYLTPELIDAVNKLNQLVEEALNPHMEQNPAPQARFCPNCVPDYLNGHLLSPPVIPIQETGYGAGKFRRCHRLELEGVYRSCGMSYDIGDRDHVLQQWLSIIKKHGNPDHYSDAVAVYVADEGMEGLKKFVRLVESWKKDCNLYDYGNHVIVLAWMALTCSWPYMAVLSKGPSFKEQILAWEGPLPSPPRIVPRMDLARGG